MMSGPPAGFRQQNGPVHWPPQRRTPDLRGRGEVERVIIIGRDLSGFYEFLQGRQQTRDGALVLLDRREAGSAPRPLCEERRAPVPDAAAALMSVLGFMVLHRAEDRWLP